MTPSAATFLATRRPDTRALDKSIDAPDFAEFRRLKRLRLAEDAALTIWPRSPSPELEPLLAEDDSAAAAAPGQPAAAAAAATEVVAEQDPEAAKLDQAELALFMCGPSHDDVVILVRAVSGMCPFRAFPCN